MSIVTRFAAMTACLLLGLAGCGGGSGSSAGPPPSGGEPPPEQPLGDLTVTVTARDAFGDVVPDAAITLLYSSGTGFLETDVRTDVNGRATIDYAPGNVYAAYLTAEALFGISYEPDEPAEHQMDFEVILHPFAELSTGVSHIRISDVSADARRLTFTARLYVIESYAEQDSWYWRDVEAQACDDCIRGPDDFMAAYTSSTLSNKQAEPDLVSNPLAVALLLDQGDSVAVNDPEDRRLLAARYLPTRLAADDEMVLAAFAEDDAESGQAALLPSQPVTIFPVDQPAFTTDGESYFTAIESLAALEGGGSPLYGAAGEMVEFTASASQVDSRRAVVVVTSHGDSGCTGPAACRAELDALLAQSASTDVAVVAVELADPSGQFDREGLGPLAQGEQGAVFWAEDPRQVPTILGRVPEILDARHSAIDVKVRLESLMAGAFAAGNLVTGTLQITLCPWDCDVLVSVPFGLRVP